MDKQKVLYLYNEIFYFIIKGNVVLIMCYNMKKNLEDVTLS